MRTLPLRRLPFVMSLGGDGEGNRRRRQGLRSGGQVREEGTVGNCECGLLIARNEVFIDGVENLARTRLEM
jgi:hypothetical protein